MPIKLGKSYIPQKNTLLSIVWKNFWNCKNFRHGRLQTSFSKSDAVKVREHVHPQDGAMLTFFHKWSSPLLVLSIDVSFVLKFFWKGDKNFKKLNKRSNIYGGPCTWRLLIIKHCHNYLTYLQITSWNSNMKWCVIKPIFGILILKIFNHHLASGYITLFCCNMECIFSRKLRNRNWVFPTTSSYSYG